MVVTPSGASSGITWSPLEDEKEELASEEFVLVDGEGEGEGDGEG